MHALRPGGHQQIVTAVDGRAVKVLGRHGIDGLFQQAVNTLCVDVPKRIDMSPLVQRHIKSPDELKHFIDLIPRTDHHQLVRALVGGDCHGWPALGLARASAGESLRNLRAQLSRVDIVDPLELEDSLGSGLVNQFNELSNPPQVGGIVGDDQEASTGTTTDVAPLLRKNGSTTFATRSAAM